jgi:L-serine dehydratase
MGAGIFDVIGPVMVGPSSSHTAGAVRIAAIAKKVCGAIPARVEFYLHGSFAETFRGHGTDNALVGGILGMSPSDERLVDSFQYARKMGMEYEFKTADLGDVHPNTIKILMHAQDGNIHEVIGSSIGGGSVIIKSVDNARVEFTGQYPTILTIHEDRPGLIAGVTSLFASNRINIAFLKVFRNSRGSDATMVVETDDQISADLIAAINKLEGIKKVVCIDLVGEEVEVGKDVPV